MDPEYEAAKASMEAAGGMEAIGQLSPSQGGVSVNDSIAPEVADVPKISTTEVEQPEGETTLEAPAPTEPAQPEAEGAPKVEAPKTEAQKRE
jgi:hypothetical protein